MSKILWGHKACEPVYFEDIISTCEEQFNEAQKWASNNGYDSFRIADIDGAPDFINTINL